jgi:hypothetical protein
MALLSYLSSKPFSLFSSPLPVRRLLLTLSTHAVNRNKLLLISNRCVYEDEHNCISPLSQLQTADWKFSSLLLVRTLNVGCQINQHQVAEFYSQETIITETNRCCISSMVSVSIHRINKKTHGASNQPNHRVTVQHNQLITLSTHACC